MPFRVDAQTGTKSDPASLRFALNEDRPLFAFAGIWTTFNGTKSKPIPGPHQVYGFLTTAPNAAVEPIHSKAMPVILTTDAERDTLINPYLASLRTGASTSRE